MRKPLAALLALTTLIAATAPAQQSAQQPPEGSNWHHVQALHVGSSLIVSARTGHASCTLKSVDADTLTCTHGKDVVFQRTDIWFIKVSRRGRSAAIGLGIGAGTGAGIGAATCHGDGRQICAIGLGVPLAGAGLLAGFFTDFSRSTVYRAP